MLIARPAAAPRAGAERRPAGFDLLRLAPIRRFIRWPAFPYVLQAALLGAFVALVIFGWRATAPPGVPAKLFAKCHLTTLLVWGLWWPAMVWTAVLFGRAWCMACPLELVANVSERIARRLGLRQVALTRWIAAGGLILSLYALIQLAVAGLWLHRNPHLTSIFLCGLLGLAAATGALFKDRAFCRGFCPAGLLLATYGRGGMIAVRAGGPAACATCDGQHCLQNCNRNRLDARSCPSLLNPPKLNSNRDCLVCGQCIKVCTPDNMQLLLRPPFSRGDVRESAASWPVTLFVLLASGFVAGELCAEWPAAQRWFVAAPEHVAHALGVPGFAGAAEGTWQLVVVPLIAWAVFGTMARAAGLGRSLGEAWRRLALPLAVVVSAGHMAKGLAKLNTWAGHLPGALAEPFGARAAQIAAQAVAPPAALIPLGAVAFTSLALLAASTVLALREAQLAGGRPRTHAAPVLILATAYALIIAGWLRTG